MSCLNLKGLFPTAKVLKLLSTKLIPFKLHRLNRSKVIKKKQQHRKTPFADKAIIKKGGAGRWPKLTGRAKRKKFQFKTAKRLDFHKKPAPVYIDQLFPAPAVKEQPEIPDAKKWVPGLKKDGCDHRLDDREEAMSMAACSSTAGFEDVDGGSGEADDMWEAIVLGSPEMHGINERAEEFISNFRAEMKRQETLDKRL